MNKEQLKIELHASYFFDLATFPHFSIFDDQKYVWEALNKISQYLGSLRLGNIETDVPQNAHLVDPHLISIGKGTVIEPGAYIKGPCFIGKDCTIRHGAYIRGNVITGNGCVIGHDSEVKNSIFLNDAKAPHFAYVGDSILGNHVNLGAGTICANLRLDHCEVNVSYMQQHIKTGLKKFGSIFGDHTQIGCNCVVNPGTLIGSHVQCYPLQSLSGFIPSKSVIRVSRGLS